MGARLGRLCVRLLLRRGQVGQKTKEDSRVGAESPFYDRAPHVVPTQKNGANKASSLVFVPGLQDGRSTRDFGDDGPQYEFYFGHLRAVGRAAGTLGPARRRDALAARRLRRGKC